MHGDLARNWTVASLATAVTMSRSSFALRFKTTVGIAPADYLTRLPMAVTSWPCSAASGASLNRSFTFR